jgi:sialidase-1
MEVIEAPGALGSSANPATVVDRSNGRTWLLYLRCAPERSSTTARPGTDDTKVLARTSDDNGTTWGEPIDLTAVARDAADPKWRISVMGPGGMIQARDGRLIAPFWKFEPFGNFAIWSDDHGKTWHRGGFVPGGTGDENQLVELTDGRVMMDFRQSSGPRRWRSISEDGGRTWGERRPGEVVKPVCCAIERVGDRIVWTGPKGPDRRNLVVRISTDEGVTFPVEKAIAPGFAAYSDLAVLKNGDVGVLWESGAERGYQAITFTRLTRAFLNLDAPAP